MGQQPNLEPINIRILINPCLEGYVGVCLDSFQAVLESTPEGAAKSITRDINERLSLYTWGFPLEKLLDGRTPRQYHQNYSNGQLFQYQPSLSQEVFALLNSIEYRLNPELLDQQTINVLIHGIPPDSVSTQQTSLL